jgi:CRISPR-associated endonuclease/helicase Cas3
LEDHLTAVGNLAADRASAFGAAECGRVAGLLHDLGKYTTAFQERLKGARIRVNHSSWGARIACERYGAFGKLLAYGIAGHHAGLANGRDTAKRSCLKDRLDSDLPDLLPDWQQEIILPEADSLRPPGDFTRCGGRPQFQLAFFARMVFSCLVDADFMDTEAFYKQIEGGSNLRNGSVPQLESLRDALDRFLAQFVADKPVNVLRTEVLHHVRSHAEWTPGLFSLTVPTGGGKTLASLAFALDHAIRYGLRRVIYVIPFTSIVEQTAAVFREALGGLGDQAVLEHHSAFIDDEVKAPESRQKLKLAMANWDAPIVVTTAVQFFESLFADRPSKCRKLHNIAGSVVVLDEAQILPLKLLRPCVASLDELARNYRCSIVLCTATQPALNAPEFVGGFENVRELAPEPQRLFRTMKRVHVNHLGHMDDDALVERITAGHQVLCIVNNRGHARALYESVASFPGAYHLSTFMCAKHRSKVLANVKSTLKDGKPCRLIATSLVEAGVDVDFATVLRAETGLDSIVQAAGRCNREGKRSIEDSEVLIFRPDNDKWPPPPELDQFAQAAREGLRHHPNDPLSLAAIQSYFSLLYWQKGVDALDKYDLLGLFERGGLDGMPFETVAAKFRMIDSGQCPVIIPFDDTARKELDALIYAERAGGIAKRL